MKTREDSAELVVHNTLLWRYFTGKNPAIPMLWVKGRVRAIQKVLDGRKKAS